MATLTMEEALRAVGELRAAYEAERRLADLLAEIVSTGVPINCVVCTNHMRNMTGPAKGCDGNCQFDAGLPKTAEDVRRYFMVLLSKK